MVPSPQPRSSTSRSLRDADPIDEILAAVPHARRDPREVALLPQCLVRIHLHALLSSTRWAMGSPIGSAIGSSQGQHPPERMRLGCAGPEIGVQAVCRRPASALARLRGVDDRLEIRVLGSIDLVRDGRVGADRRAEAAARARFPGRPSRRGRVDGTALRGAVGRHVPRSIRRRCCRASVSRLRKLLRPEAEIVARPPGYVLQAADGTVDAERFELLCTTAKSVGDPVRAADPAPRPRWPAGRGVRVRGVRGARLGRRRGGAARRAAGQRPRRPARRPPRVRRARGARR